MVWLSSLSVTFGLILVGMYGPEPTMWVIVIGSAIWAAMDSQKIGLIKYKTTASNTPVVILIGVIVMWIVFFPWYLIARGNILNGTTVLKDKFR